MRACVVALGLALLSAAALAQPPAAEATGTVWVTLLPEPSRPLRSPRVRIAGQEAVLDSSGAFRVEGLAPGQVRVSASAEGYHPREQQVRLEAGGQSSVLLPLERIPGPGTVRGLVLLQNDGHAGAGTPLAGVEVRLADQLVATSDADGRFVLPAVEPGAVSLKLTGAGLRPQEEVVRVPPDAETSVEVVLRKATTLQAWMKGQVRSTTGKPLRATLKVAEPRRVVRTRPGGDFEFRLPAGRYQVTFEARGHVPQTKVVDVAEGEQALFYVDLSPREN
jgi:Carboxypeptidase regulatory-like domain